MGNEERAVFRVATPFLWWTIYEEGQRWTFLRVLNVVVFLLLIPVILAYMLIGKMFSKPSDRSAVARFISDRISGRDGYRDWDDFLSIPIMNPELDEIRLNAAAEQDEHGLKQLLARALAIRENEVTGS